MQEKERTARDGFRDMEALLKVEAEKQASRPQLRLHSRADNPLKTGAKYTSGHVTASFGDTEFVLFRTLKVLGLTPSKLARIIGISTSHAAQWCNGSHSPSHAYLVRILYLCALALQGVDMADVRTVDWSTKNPWAIEYWPGKSPEEKAEASKAINQIPTQGAGDSK